MKTLSEGQFTDRVLEQMAGTFNTLAKEADFSTPPTRTAMPPDAPPEPDEGVPQQTAPGGAEHPQVASPTPSIYPP